MHRQYNFKKFFLLLFIANKREGRGCCSPPAANVANFRIFVDDIVKLAGRKIYDMSMKTFEDALRINFSIFNYPTGRSGDKLHTALNITHMR